MTRLQKAFHDQALACGNLGSPFMLRLLNFLADAWPNDTKLARACDQYIGDIGPAAISLPLRISGGLHALCLQDDPELTKVYPPNQPGDAEFERAILAAIDKHADFLCAWIQSPPQTNEIRRSAALIPAMHYICREHDLPIWLSELGASGGLNLMWDQFSLQTANWGRGPENAAVTLRPDWNGAPPPEAAPVVAQRRGVDLNPLDPTSPADLLRLSSYLWADQPDRLKMTKAAAGSVPAPVDKGDAIEWLEDRLTQAPDGHVHIIQNTVAWQYFPQKAQAKGLQLLEAAGEHATSTKPMAWVQLETDGDLHGLGGGALSVRIWPGGETISLGRADFHGRWVNWNPKPAQ